MGVYRGTVPKQLTGGDKDFIKRIEAGEKKASAFRAAYPDHPSVIGWHRSEPGSPDRQKYVELVVAAAKNKLQAKYMQSAIKTYQDSMEEFSNESLKTAIELVKSARSEKVRADLAIEGIRHKIGTPVQKVAVHQEQTVTITFGEPPKDDVIDGEVVPPKDDLDGTFGI